MAFSSLYSLSREGYELDYPESLSLSLSAEHANSQIAIAEEYTNYHYGKSNCPLILENQLLRKEQLDHIVTRIRYM